MSKKGGGWKNESQRHRMASMGISTTYKYKGSGKRKLQIMLPEYTKKQISHITQMADEGSKEWIAELKVKNGQIYMDDIQISNEVDHSYLNWSTGDENEDVGYIHFHPKSLIPEFTAQDFVLACNIHELRKNKESYPYTIMGLIYPTKKGYEIRMYGVNPGEDRKNDFDGLIAVESDMKDKLKKMEASGELIRMKEKNGKK